MSPAPRSRAHRGPNRYGHSETSDVQAKEAERYGVKLDDGKLLKVPPFCAQHARIRAGGIELSVCFVPVSCAGGGPSQKPDTQAQPENKQPNTPA
jgi:hypothetical protein